MCIGAQRSIIKTRRAYLYALEPSLREKVCPIDPRGLSALIRAKKAGDPLPAMQFCMRELHEMYPEARCVECYKLFSESSRLNQCSVCEKVTCDCLEFCAHCNEYVCGECIEFCYECGTTVCTSERKYCVDFCNRCSVYVCGDGCGWRGTVTDVDGDEMLYTMCSACEESVILD